MAIDLSETLVVGISATALFDLREAQAVFDSKFKEDRESAIDEYRAYMLERENDPLDDGTGMPLVRALLHLNAYGKKSESPLVEVVVMSRNSPETGVRVFRNIRRRGLPISRHAFTGGESVIDYLEAYSVDLFLTTNVGDAQKIIDSGSAAAAVLHAPPSEPSVIPEGQVRIAFDGDAVLFDESSELVYQTEGIESFHRNEDASQNLPLPEGPYASFLKKLSKLRQRLPGRVEFSPVRIAVVTARSAPAEMRVIQTLRNWGVYVDQVFFLGGLDKARILQSLKPHIFFDDQELHLEKASSRTPSGQVPYRSDSPLRAVRK